ncbi:hypothetical protein AB0M46_16975 [Dactylosporangium sp. NPDC051485]|uniref:hypothetical protein n=1 Tax=Dactylosporangium sp. NPDC051485 TaxID=3154846 RepID=UPI003437DEA0
MHDDGKRFRANLQVAGTIVGILAAVTPGVIWAVDHFGHKDPKPGATTQAQSAGQSGAGKQPAPPPATTAAGPTTVATMPVVAENRVYLDSLAPDTGSTNLADLPRALKEQPGYEHPVTMPCGSNNSGDTKRLVSYLLEKRYVNLTADVHSYKANPDEYKVQLRFYADNAQPQAVMLTGNQQQQFTMSVDGVKKLTLELTCERSGALVTLANAWFDRA